MKTLCIYLTLLSAFAAAGVQAQPSYDTASIPNELKTNAHVIKRYENIRFDVKDVDRAVYSVHRVYTIMDEQGAHKMFFAEYTTRYRKIEEFEIKGYDANGKVVERFKKRDLTRQAILDGLATEGSYYYIRLGASRYPATIEYKYEIEYSGTAWYPDYDIQEPGESVEQSSFTATVPEDLDLRFKPKHTNVKATVNNNGGSKSYHWAVNKLTALPDEESEAEGGSNSPTVVLAPNRFRLYNTYGDMSTWKSFGAWGYELLKDQDKLPENRKQFFANLVKDAKTDREKAAIIYDYLQKNFRYVSIQLGIGGYKPFPVSFTDEKKYGDCKGLSFFMYSVLKHLGVKSYCALVYRDYDQQENDPEFAYNRFNHMILCIPQKSDSIWLECTSNTAEFGVLDPTTSDKNALLLTENGGVLVPTAKGRSIQNTQTSSTELWLDEDGSGKSKTSLTTRGDFRDAMLEFTEAKRDDQKVFLVRHLGFKQPDDFIVSQKSKTEKLELEIATYVEKVPQFMAGSKMFLAPRLNSLWSSKLPSAENRKTDFYFKAPFIKTDTSVYYLPEGFVAEVLPKPVVVTCEFAEYSFDCSYDAATRKVVSVGKLQLNRNRIPAAKYAEVKACFDRVLSSETQKLVVKRG
jgi:transglutaminase-like putative cysteine protease